jgi:hypothetical protein
MTSLGILLEALRRPLHAAVAVAALLGGSLTACTVFDDLTVPTSSGTGSTGGVTSGTGGAGPGSGGASATSSTGAGGAGTGGAGGGASAAVTYLSTSEAARVCSHAFACSNLAASIATSLGVPVGDANFSQCMTWLAGPVASDHPGLAEQTSILKCVAAASECSSAAACLPYQVIDAKDQACSDSMSKCLDGATAIDCAAFVIQNCDTPGFVDGSACLSKDGEAACVKDTCNTPGATSCDGDALLTCGASGLTRSSCATQGLTCAPMGQGAACAGKGACTTAGESSCEGDAVLVCTGKGTGASLAPWSCSAIDMSCATDASGVAYCEPAGAECSPFTDNVNLCSGNKKVRVCVGGKVMDINCPFGKCSGPSNGKTAHCG